MTDSSILTTLTQSDNTFGPNKGTFRPYKGSNPCPVCDRNNGDCREIGELILCMGDPGDGQGYHRVKSTKDDLWGVYAFGERRSPLGLEELRAVRQQRIKKRAEDEQKRRKASLSPRERDRHYRIILDELRAQNGLSAEALRDLEKRGISKDEALAHGFVSVERWQPLSKLYPATLAGIGRGRRSLLVGEPGYLCPCYDDKGLLSGFQYRLTGDTDGGRYRWLAGNSRHKLPDGDQPLAVIGDRHAETVYLVEGTGAKPYLAHRKLGGLVIGAAGGQHMNSPRMLQRLTEGKRVIIVPDAGAIRNKAIYAQHTKIKGAIANLEVLWWGQVEKDAPDIDELTTEKPRIINWDRYRQLKQPELRELNAAKHRQMSIQSRIPDEIRDERYLRAIALKYGGIVAVSSPCNTGKTTQLGEVVRQHRKDHPEAKRLMIGYRNNLLRQTGSPSKLDIPLIHDLRGAQVPVSPNKAADIALCMDSILSLDVAQIPEHSLLILDEVDAILKHTLAGETLKDSHARILENFQNLIQTVLAKNGAVIVSEDAVSDLTLETLEAIAAVRPYLIRNTHQSEPWEVKISHIGRSGFDREIIDRLLDGDRIAVATSNQIYAEQLEIAVYEHAPHIRTLRIDRETSHLDSTKGLLRSPDKYLSENPTQLLIYTSSMESGVDITGDHFDAMYGYFTHLEDRAQYQLLSRVRSPIPRYLFTPLSGSPDHNKGIDPRKIARAWESATEYTGSLSKVVDSLTDEGKEKWADRFSDKSRFWNDLIATYNARLNASLCRLQDALRDRLIDHGHSVITTQWRTDKATSDLFRQAKEQIEQAKAQLLAIAQPGEMTASDAYEILKSTTATADDRTRARKRLIQERLPGDELDQDFIHGAVIRERGRFLRSTEQLWLTNHPDLAADMDRRAIANRTTDPFFIHKTMTKNSLFTEIMKGSGVLPLLDGREYREDDDIVRKAREYAIDNSYLIWVTLQMHVNKDQTGISIVNRLIKKLGHQARLARKEGARGAQIRIWTTTPDPTVQSNDQEYRDRIFKALNIKYAGKIDPVGATLVDSMVDTEIAPTDVEGWTSEAEMLLEGCETELERSLILSYLPPQLQKQLA